MIFFTGGMTSLRGVRAVAAGMAAAVLLAGLSGCSLGTMQLSGPEPVATVAVNMTGTVHGGQQAVKGAKVQLWAVGSGSYGAAAHELTSTSTTNYHPGGTTGCSTTPAAITAIASASSVVTVTAANTLVAGDYVTFAGLSTPLGTAMDNAGGTFVVLTSTSSSFTANRSGFSYADTATTADSGTSTATCYSSVVTDYYGNFSLTGDYSCGSYSASDVYITATGGNPGLVQGTNNTASKMVALLYAAPASTGAPVALTCSTLSSSTVTIVNEVTTAAAAFALAQYYGNGGFGGPTSTQGALGFSNAFLTGALLANSTTGNAVTSTTLTGSGGTVVATPDPNKLYTIADILAACINSAGGTAGDGSNCGTLFADAVPTGGAALSDTLAAAVDLNLNPISTNANGSAANLTALYGLSQGTGAPYPSLAAQPTDWTMGINYINATALIQPLDLAADSFGNIWVISTGGGLAEITPTGVPNFYSTTFGSSSTSISGSNPRNLALDTANNVYITTSSSPYNEVKYTPGSASTAATVLAFASPINKSPYGIAIDGSNDVFMGLQSSSTTVEIVEFPAGNFSLTGYVTFPLDGGNATTVAPEYMAVDTSGNLWMDDGSSSTITGVATNSNLTQLTGIAAANATCSSYPCTIAPGGVTYNNYTVTGAGEPWGLAAGASTMWAANAGSGVNSVTSVTLAGANSSGSPYTPSTLADSPHYLAVDGTGNVWVANKNTGSAPAGGTVSEFTSAGVLLSGLGSATVPGGFNHVGLNSGEGIAVDPSGNVWVASNAAGYGIEEIVGAASPTVTPIALALKNGTVAAKP